MLFNNNRSSIKQTLSLFQNSSSKRGNIVVWKIRKLTPPPFNFSDIAYLFRQKRKRRDQNHWGFFLLNICALWKWHALRQMVLCNMNIFTCSVALPTWPDLRQVSFFKITWYASSIVLSTWKSVVFPTWKDLLRLTYQKVQEIHINPLTQLIAHIKFHQIFNCSTETSRPGGPSTSSSI